MLSLRPNMTPCWVTNNPQQLSSECPKTSTGFKPEPYFSILSTQNFINIVNASKFFRNPVLSRVDVSNLVFLLKIRSEGLAQVNQAGPYATVFSFNATIEIESKYFLNLLENIYTPISTFSFYIKCTLQLIKTCRSINLI